MAAFSPLLDVLADVPDPRRAQGQLYKLPYVLLFAILAIVTGCNSYRGIVTFIDVHRQRLNAAFSLKWKRAPAHTAIRYILQGLDPAAVEVAFRRHAALLQAARATPGQGSIALDGKTLRGSFDKFNDRSAAQLLSAFATDTTLVLAHVDIAEKSNEIPAAQTLLAELGLAPGAIVTLDALHCQKTSRHRGSGQRRPDRRRQGQPADPGPDDPGGRGHHGTARVCPQPRQGPQPRRTPHRHRFDPADSLADTDWHPHVAAIVRIERSVYTRNVKTGLLRHSAETAFYISNTPVPATCAAEAIRAHWKIENTSHYSRDVTLGEDRSRIRTNPSVFARLRSFAFNILKANHTDTLSQDRYRAGLTGVNEVLKMLAVS